MKIKLSLVIIIIFALVLVTCSEWKGDEGTVSIRIVGENGSSGGGGRAITQDGDDYGYPKDSEILVEDSNGGGHYGPKDPNTKPLQLKDFVYDIYFVKKVYPSKKGKQLDDGRFEILENDEIPKDNIVGGGGNLNYGAQAACSMVPGTYTLIINAFYDKEGDGIRAQGTLIDVEIKPGKNEDITIPMKNTRKEGYVNPALGEPNVAPSKGAHF